ncbi:MAG: sugar transferase [Actinomycetota bacterium]|nr:sugar transferase [Actinomycetota bacterium]
MEISGARRGPEASGVADASLASAVEGRAPLRGGVPKRAFDLGVSAIALVLLSPSFLVVAVLIRMTSAGPVFYRQERVGRGGRVFRIWKFRTMVSDADRLGPKVSPGNDPRITRVGAALRRWYVDEFPQLLNVLAGQMSLVGPRPESPEYAAMYTPSERRVLEVRPGIVGPSTLGHMDETDVLSGVGDPQAHYVEHILHDRVRLDLEYLDRCSVGFDVRFLARQAWAIVRHGR